MSERKPSRGPHNSKSLQEKFLVKVGSPDKNDCWLGGKNNMGYGTLHRGSGVPGSRLAHRISWELVNGSIPPGICVLHRCDNPACVNPSHLWLGSMKDNSQDMARKGRDGRHSKPDATARGSGHGMAKLTEAKVVEIRRRYAEVPIPQKPDHSISPVWWNLFL